MSASALVLNGSISTLPSRAALAAAGAAFTVTNPTPGTAIAYANKTAYSATANGLFCVSNNNAVGGKNIILDTWTQIQTATAPANTLVARYEIVGESGIVALSGNAAARTPVNLNGSASNVTGAVVTTFAAGAGTVAAAVGTRRILGVLALNCGVSVIHDKWVLQFGGDPVARVGLTAARATDNAAMVAAAPAIVIPPQYSVWVNNWTLTGDTNVPSFEFALNYFEV